MEKKAFTIVLKELFKKLASYFKSETFKKAFFDALKSVKDSIWNSVKEEVHRVAEEIITDVEKYLASAEAEEKKEVILDKIMKNIKLPLLLKPFKGIVKKIIKDQIDGLIADVLKKSKDALNLKS